MFSQILDCPKCNHRFEYTYEGAMPPKIECPECRQTSPVEDYCLLLFCPECHAKLSMQIECLKGDTFNCPGCGQSFPVSKVVENFNIGPEIQSEEKQVQEDEPKKNLLEPGDFFDKYKIIRCLGSGGMAEVYLAEHQLLDRKCAVKVMRPSVYTDNPVFVKRFIQEAKLSYNVKHPNIVKVYDAGRDIRTGYLFIVMEYVQGQNLAEIAYKYDIAEDEILRISLEVARALEALHQNNIVHRDIKPSNIMLCPDNSVRLMDLGIAKHEHTANDGEATMTAEKGLIGTPAYASPEQCRSSHNVDVRSDIYCLGATIYHLAVGRPPFQGKTSMDIVTKVLREEPKSMFDYRKDLSPRFQRLVQKMMRKNPAQRHQTPAELVRDMEAAYQEAIAAPPKKSPAQQHAEQIKARVNEKPPSSQGVWAFLRANMMYVYFVILLPIVGIVFMMALRNLRGVEPEPADGEGVVQQEVTPIEEIQEPQEQDEGLVRTEQEAKPALLELGDEDGGEEEEIPEPKPEPEKEPEKELAKEPAAEEHPQETVSEEQDTREEKAEKPRKKKQKKEEKIEEKEEEELAPEEEEKEKKPIQDEKDKIIKKGEAKLTKEQIDLVKSAIHTNNIRELKKVFRREDLPVISAFIEEAINSYNLQALKFFVDTQNYDLRYYDSLACALQLKGNLQDTLEIIRYLEKRGAPMTEAAMSKACQSATYDIVFHLFKKHKPKNELLAYAVLNKNPKVFQYVIEKGANVKYRDENGRNLLHILAKDLKHIENMKILLNKYKLDPNIKDNEGHSPMFYVLTSTSQKKGDNIPLETHIDHIKLLQHYKCKVSQEDWETPLATVNSEVMKQLKK